MVALYSLSTLAPATRAEIVALRAAGRSCDAIAAALNKRGVRWYGATIHRILQLAAPAGQAAPSLLRRAAISVSGAAENGPEG